MIHPLRYLVGGAVVAIAIAILSLVQLLLDQPAALETTDLLQGGSGAYEALGFLARQRAYPRATLPPQGYGSAFAQAQAMSKRKLDTQWEAMGPHNIAGRMLAVALNPQNPGTVWAGSAGGGLWRSHTGGVGAAAWSYVATGHPVLAVSAIVIAPADSNVIYIGTGEVYNHTNTQGGVAIRETRGSYGMGILKSTNNGRTWVRSLDWSRNQQRGVQMLRINPKNPNTVWAATTEGVYVTHDAGANWHRSLDVVMATDVVIHPVDTSLVFAACGNLGSSGKIIQGWFSHFVAVHPEDPDVLLAAGIPLYKSTDGGRTLQIKSTHFPRDPEPPIGGPAGPATYIHVDMHGFVYHPEDPSIVYIATDGGMYRTVDGAETFEYVSGGLQTAQFYSGISNAFDDSLFALGGLQDNGVVLYQGTPRWRIGRFADGTYTAIDPRDKNRVYSATQFLFLVPSLDGGLTWDELGADISPPIAAFEETSFAAPFVLAPSDPDMLYAGREIVYKSIFRGTNWIATNGGQALDGNPVLALAVSYINPDIVYAATAPVQVRAGLFRSLDGGQTWTTITGGLPDRYPMDLAVDPTNDATVYVVFSGFGTSHVFKTSDAGGTWEDIGVGLPDVPTSAVAVDPLFPDTIFVGNDLGVFLSKDGGLNWEAFNAGLPDAVMVMDLVVSSSNRKLRVATHGNGMYERQLPRTVDFPTPITSQPSAALFVLNQNYPNPFRTHTTIAFELAEPAFVQLVVLDAQGREVVRLLNAFMGSGKHVVPFDAHSLAAGSYFYRLRAGNRSAVRLMSHVH